MAWNKFFKITVSSIIVLSLVIFGFNVVMDPYNVLHASPNFKRALVSSNQRFAYPSIAKNKEFDSAIIGTSTSRLLKPLQLNKLYDANFVNLSMDDARSYEQYRMLKLFTKYHSAPKVVILDIDAPWCETIANPNKSNRYLPLWMYDDSQLQEYLHLFNRTALKQSIRQLQYKMGKRKPRFDDDGYKNFLPDNSEYNLEQAKAGIYNIYKDKNKLSAIEYKEYYDSLNFVNLAYLPETLNKLPNTTKKIIFFAPYNHHMQAISGTKDYAVWDKCKNNIVQIANKLDNVTVIDFMIKSPITEDDSNYWDPIHYGVNTAKRLVDDIFLASNKGTLNKDYKILKGGIYE